MSYPETAPVSLCPHFGECGGCQTQQLPYPEQLAQKESLLRSLFAPFWEHPIPVAPSPVLWHYRNKVDPSFAPKQYPEAPPKGFERETVLGYKRKGRWFWPIEIETCLIGPEGLPKLLDAVRAWHRAAGLRAFDSRTGEGFLQCLLVRDAKRTGERMVMLITRAGAFDAAPFVQAVLESFAPQSIYRGIRHGTSDVAFADEVELLYGTPEIAERLIIPDDERPQELQFRISPFSFFQTNTLATEQLYGRARAWVKSCRPRVLYDLYGGMGGIAFSCAGLVDHVWSVENVASASEDGRHNAELNGIGNVTFETEKVEAYLKRMLAEGRGTEEAAVIVDPPRAGMHPKALKRLIEWGPPHVLYISCNPKILAQELPALLERYTLQSLSAVDLFPHTKHVEVVAEFAMTQ